MKRLAQLVSLAGKTETISITEFRQRPGEVITQVEMGMTFDVTRNGKVVATISKPEPNALEMGKAARDAGLCRDHVHPHRKK
jgi:antitoxin (DNA-binding transcriptional repressor) of toxin-antitoxin stability system